MITHRSSWVRTYPVLTFYLLAFLISWLGWIPSLLATRGMVFFEHSYWIICLLLPTLGPTIAAKLTIDWQGQFSIPLPILFRQPPVYQWYALAVGLPLLVIWSANGLSQWLPSTISSAPIQGSQLAIFLLLSLLVNPWEEIGWRSFALRRLQQHYSVFTASALVGILWGIWHLPLFSIHRGPMSMSLIPFFPWLVGILGWSFVMSWLFNYTAGNLLLCSLCHIASNGFSAALGIRSYWTLAITKLILALFLWLFRKPTLYTGLSTLAPSTKRYGNPS